MEELNRIIQVATELFFKYGIKSISMDDIAQHLGVSKKTLYLHIENKTALVEKSIKVMDAQIDAKVESIIHDKELNAIEQLIKIADFNSELLQKIKPVVLYDLKKYYKSLWDEMEVNHTQITNLLITENIEHGIKQGFYRADINVPIIAKFFALQIKELTNIDYFPSETFNLVEVYIEFLRYHIRGIASEKGINYFQKIITNVKNQQTF